MFLTFIFAVFVTVFVGFWAIKMGKNPIKVALPFGALVIMCGLVMSSVTIVSPGHVGVQVVLGEVNLEQLPEGIHIINPVSSVKELEVRVVKEVVPQASAGTKDLQQVHTDLVVNYRLAGLKAAYIYKDFGFDVADKVLNPAIQEAFKAVTAKYNSEELITKREEVSLAVLSHLKEKVAQYDITITSVSLQNFAFSPEYQKAIEQKVISTQQKLKAEQDLARIEVEARQAIAVAEGKAKAIQIETTAINSQGGINYIELKRIEKWDGKYPTTVAGNSPLMFNLGNSK
jgi:prohibitin 2